MDEYSRRSVLRGSLGLAAAAKLSKPYVANAAANRCRTCPSLNEVAAAAADDRIIVIGLDSIATASRYRGVP